MSPSGEQRETFKKYVFFNSQLLKLRKNVELYLQSPGSITYYSSPG
jgi:hypothetical protein